METLKRDRLKLGIIVLALALFVSGAGLYLLRQTYAPIRTEAVRQAMREMKAIFPLAASTPSSKPFP